MTLEEAVAQVAAAKLEFDAATQAAADSKARLSAATDAIETANKRMNAILAGLIQDATVSQSGKVKS